MFVTTEQKYMKFRYLLCNMLRNVYGNDNDSTPVQDFNSDLWKALTDQFALISESTAKYLFVTATVLDPAKKSCTLFSDCSQGSV